MFLPVLQYLFPKNEKKYLILRDFMVYLKEHRNKRTQYIDRKRDCDMKIFNRAALAAILAAAALFLGSCSEESADLADYDLDDYVTLCEYKGVEIPRTVITVDDDSVRDRVDDLLDQYAETVDLTAADPIALKDTVYITYEGFIKGEYEGWTDNEKFTEYTNESGYKLVIGSNSFIPGFEDALIGYHVGDTVEFDITFPNTYKNVKLRGVLTHFNVTIRSGKRGIQPEYTDAFVAEKTDYETIADYEAYLRGVLREEADKQELLAELSAVWQYVISNSKAIKYPEAVVAKQIEASKASITSYYGMTLEEYAEQSGMTMAALETKIEKQSREYVFEQMVLNLIIEREEITISDKEYTDGLAKYAEENGFKDSKTCEEYYGEGTIRQSLIWDKVLMFLVEKAEIKDMETATS